MRILGIESSCDETAAAVVENGETLLSNVVNSQIDLHSVYGGVIPEVAARSHVEVILPVIDAALQKANCTWDDIDAMAVTYAPGLIGSLLIGTLAARTIAFLKQKPIYAVHHVEGHVYANFITRGNEGLGSWAFGVRKGSQEKSREQGDTQAAAMANGRWNMEDGKRKDKSDSDYVMGSVGRSRSDALASGAATVLQQDTKSKVQPESERPSGSDGPTSSGVLAKSSRQSQLDLPRHQPQFPLLALIVSGGHSQLVLFRGHGDYHLLGQTQDDAVGEAFDKVAKIIGLPYPGGPSIAKAALEGDYQAYKFPKSKLANPYDFSFSGLKTAALRTVQRECGVDHRFPSHRLPELVSERLRNDIAASFQYTAVETLVDAAIKAYNEYSPASVVIAGGVAANQELRRQLSDRLPMDIEYAPISLCTDNAAMIATLAYYMAQSVEPDDPLSLEVVPSLSMVDSKWLPTAS